MNTLAIQQPASAKKINDHPILFSGSMIRAILSSKKSQTRRIMNPQPTNDFNPPNGGIAEFYHPTMVDRRDGEIYPGPEIFGVADENQGYKSPYGHPGNRLWVKETWQAHLCAHVEHERIHYRADGECCPHDGERIKRWRPSIFLPRKFSRITLEINAIRVERLQDITEAEAQAEGVDACSLFGAAGPKYRHAYQILWNQINGRDSWDKNPWVWIIEFNAPHEPRGEKTDNRE